MLTRLSHRPARPAPGFTLIELLVTVTIAILLASIVFTVSRAASRSASQTRELHAGRQLVAAYLLAANDHGEFPPGYDRTVGEVTWPDGSTYSGPVAHRYPFRLAEYLNYELHGTVLVNDIVRQINTDDPYSVSLNPAFGMNYLFVGGDRATNGTLSLPDQVVSRPAFSANVLVFASAGNVQGGQVVHGYNLLTPPRLQGDMWSNADWTPDSPPGDFGHVHARHNGKAACAFLDGSMRLLTIEELRDMRLWNMHAAAENNPHYTVPVAPPPPRRR